MMFTLEQIKNAHAKVKSGADFPAYIQEIKNYGVVNYETYVSDGHTDYYDENGSVISSDGKYDLLDVHDESDVVLFKKILKEHQAGNSDYKGFCEGCAAAGVVKWKVEINKMMCTYFDGRGEVMLEEKIPG